MRLYKNPFRLMFSSVLCLVMSIYYINVFLVFGAASTTLTLRIISGDTSKISNGNNVSNSYMSLNQNYVPKSNIILADLSNFYTKIGIIYSNTPFLQSYFGHNSAPIFETATDITTGTAKDNDVYSQSQTVSKSLNNKNSSGTSINKEIKTGAIATGKKAQNIVHISANKILKGENKTTDSNDNTSSVSKYLTGSMHSIKSLIIEKNSLVKIIIASLFAYF